MLKDQKVIRIKEWIGYQEGHWMKYCQEATNNSTDPINTKMDGSEKTVHLHFST